ncbi:MAG TPA: hypothetical protein VMB75_00830, partial [Rhodocyclaceae bacterium]|nr:hypothetical protein [Rhodocyclaceae bacterium]
TLSNRIQTYNTEVSIQHNIDKLNAAEGWAILGDVLILASIVVSCATYGATSYGTIALIGALGAAGAVSTSIGAYDASQVSDSYDVSSPEFTLGATPGADQPHNVVEAIDAEEAAEANLTSQMANAQLMIKNNDGFYTVNSQALAAFQLEQEALQNMARMMVYLYKAMRDISRAVNAIVESYTVKDFGDNYLIGNLEASLRQRQQVMQSIIMQVTEQVAGLNIARQDQLMAHKAFGATKWGLIGEGIGFACNFIPYVNTFAPILMALGAGLGSSLYQIYDLETSPYSSLHNDFKESSQDLDRALQQRNDAAVNSGVAEDKLTVMENILFGELLANGYVGTGDGYHNVDYTLVGRIYNELEQIQVMREALEVLREGEAKISAAVREEVIGTAGEVSELGKIVTQGSFNEAMTVMQGIVRFISDKAQVMNRQRDAEKEMYMAEVSVAVDCAVAAAGAGSAAACDAAGAATSAQMIIAGTSGAMGLINAAFSIGLSAEYAYSGYGAYSDYSDTAKTVKDIKGGNAKDPLTDDPFDKLDALETQVYLQAGEQLAKSLAGDTWQMDGDLTGTLNARLHTLSVLRKMLMTLVSAEGSMSRLERRQLRAGGSQGVDQLQELASDQERTAENILNSLIEGLDVIIERHNQMSEAKTQMLVGCVSAGLQILSLALSTKASADHGNMVAEGKLAEQAAHTTPPAETASAAESPAATPSASQPLPAPAPKTAETGA